ncbi:MAG: L-threonylcarbamoyladenylate synthase [Candidatus Dormibacteraceae bacterium]
MILSSDAADLARAVTLLRAGEVIAFPTDTVYGLAALAGEKAAIQRIYQIKGRALNKQLIAMAATIEQLEPLVEVSPRARALMERWWPGPLTLVLPARKGDLPTLGVRIPNHPVALDLLRQVGAPLLTTSANLSGEPEAMSAAAAAELIGVAGIVDGGRAPGGQPSTVLSMVDGQLEVLREGPIKVK